MFLSSLAFCQSVNSSGNPITTAVPFLSVNPDPRGAGMGNAGVASTPDAFSQHHNPAKYVFYKSQKFQSDTCHYEVANEANSSGVDSHVNKLYNLLIGTSYSPWLRSLIADMNLIYLAGAGQVGETLFLSSSLKYMSMGYVIFRSDFGEDMSQLKPYEFAVDFALSKKLSPHLAGAVALRYIYSDLTSNRLINGIESNHANAYAADVAFYYTKRLSVKKNIMYGINIQNIGSKISYTNGETYYFLPTTLKLGGGLINQISNDFYLQLTLEADKLLVPTPQSKNLVFEDGTIIYPGGMQDDTPVFTALFKSFYDAPGGLIEEMREINLLLGIELDIKEKFQLRTGYFNEDKLKGNRKYMTFGTGFHILKYSIIDFSYLVPVTSNHPMANTFRASLSISI